MAEKTVSLSDLKKLESEGSTFDFEKEVLEIEQFGELVESLKTMVANEAERIRADISRNQTNLEILATLQAMIRKQGQGPKIEAPDFSPIYELLEEIRGEREARDRGAYEFTVKRDGRGFAQTITATPVAPTTH